MAVKEFTTTKHGSAVYSVTPVMAKRWLESNPQNRTVSTRRVDHYSRLILAGEWHVTNNAIAFDIDGNLIDGQHRLLAVVKAGKTVKMLVQWGLDNEVKFITDTGKAKNPSDAITMAGIAHPKEVAMFIKALGQVVCGTADLSSYRKIPNYILVKIAEDLHEDAYKAMLYTKKLCREGNIQFHVLYAANYYLMKKMYPTKCDKHFEAMLGGIEVRKYSREFKFRKTIATVPYQPGTKKKINDGPVKHVTYGVLKVFLTKEDRVMLAGVASTFKNYLPEGVFELYLEGYDKSEGAVHSSYRKQMPKENLPLFPEVEE